MIKPKIYGMFCALALISAFPLLSGTVRAELEIPSAETASEDGSYVCGGEYGELVSSDNEGNTAEGEGNGIFPAYTEDIVPAEDPVPATFDGAEMISPPYNPDSGELPPAAGEPREMFSGYDKGNGDIENIAEYWETNGYPEYISFICDQGVAEYNVATQTETIHRLWEIGIADISEEKKEEVKALVSRDQHLFFTPCGYTMEERRAIGEKLSLEFPLAEVSLSKYGEEIEVVISGYPEEERDNIESDILSVFMEENRIIRVLKSVPTIGIPETEIAVEPNESFGEESPETAPETAPGNDSEIVFPAFTQDVEPSPEPDATESAPAFATDNSPLPEQTAVYSNRDDYLTEGAPAPSIDPNKAADIEKSKNPEVEGAISEIGGVAALINQESQRSGNESLWIWISAAAAAALVITAAMILGRKRLKTFSLADGGEVSEDGKMTKAEVVKAVEESKITPSDRVFQEIVEKINKEE